MRPTNTAAPGTRAGLHERIRASILDGEWPPGTVLIPTVLSERYGVSRTPVREALIRLEQEGLVDQATRGFVVRRRSAEEILEICEARIALESSMAAAAAARRTTLDLARLAHVHDAAATETAPDERGHLNHVWHIALRDAAHNATIAALLDRLDAQLAAHDLHAITPEPVNFQLTQDEHGAILDAIRRGDPEAARSHMIAHQSRTRDLRIAAYARRPEADR
ncbi:GntR family transcriptional regulator [Yinghuangia sp. ASG 101]|uniref:GntR family transcriptional regulator n=1 Tax=Yinghuangia sp. ASG 101 TaxID=2896848 RepID=UPI001E614AE6|nr:GntR family transcriptional regulator [Yinghuangia sp. ASG 101]UGQ11565.1 GntR family transcriptional regulator [Yinghuangia sp. ASG 101]